MVALGPGDLHRGDVEVHIRSSSWRAHGHQHDPAYNQVVLHVVLRADDPSPTRKADGATALVVSLEAGLLEQGLLSEDAAEDTDTDEESPPFCRLQPVLPEVLGSILDWAGEERLRQKATVFEAVLQLKDEVSPAQPLYEAVLAALGYSRNAVPCRELANRLPYSLVEAIGRSPQTESAPRTARPDERPGLLEAALLGAAGLLPTSPGDADPYLADLRRLWHDVAAFWDIIPMKAKDWQFARVRPENYPPRRLAGAAHLLARHLEPSIADSLLALLSRDPAWQALEAALSVDDDRCYWSAHYDFGKLSRRPSALVGTSRAAEIAINAVLPFALSSGNRDAQQRALDVYRTYPRRTDNELSRYMLREILGTGYRRLVATACREQGLLHIYRQWCRDKRCGECAVGTTGQGGA